jgi:hypothetical protein
VHASVISLAHPRVTRPTRARLQNNKHAHSRSFLRSMPGVNFSYSAKKSKPVDVRPLVLSGSESSSAGPVPAASSVWANAPTAVRAAPVQPKISKPVLKPKKQMQEH